MAKPKDPEKYLKLLASAKELILKDPLAFNIQEVATLAGVSIAGLYVYFASKQAIIEGVLEQINNRRASILIDTFIPTDSFTTNFRQVWNALLREHYIYSDDFKVQLILGVNPYSLRELNDYELHWLKPLHKLLFEGKQLMLLKQTTLQKLVELCLRPLHFLAIFQDKQMDAKFEQELFRETWESIRF